MLARYLFRPRTLLPAALLACAPLLSATAQASALRGRLLEPGGDTPVSDAEVFIPRLNVTTR
ncbi:MAG TPA: hypothetical protein VEW03_09490, partial [Longimicrobiaceae bacterium]|nr:hypothetical protein [Longimicrobiaceae bacterium]